MLRAQPATLGAILYKSMGPRGIMPIAGCRGKAPVEVKGQRPLGTSRAFSDMCGESAPAMTQRGEHACVRSVRNVGAPGRKSLIFGWGKSPTKTNACIRFAFGRRAAWRREVKGHNAPRGVKGRSPLNIPAGVQGQSHCLWTFHSQVILS